MKVFITVLLFNLFITACSTADSLNGTRELQKRSNKGQMLQTSIKKVSISNEKMAPKRVQGSYFTAWIHGHQLTDGSYFHGGEITIIDESPTFEFE